MSDHYKTETVQLSPGVPRLDERLNALLERLRPQRLLLVTTAVAEPALRHFPPTYIIAVGNNGQMLNCRFDELPFEEGVFDMVILHGLLKDGSEPELDEAQRVLKGGGQLLIIGTGRLSSSKRRSGLPVLAIRKLARELRQRRFEIHQCDGLGLLGFEIEASRRLARPLVPLADRILVCARHRDEKPIVTPLRFRQARPAGVRTALDSVSREAV